MFKFLSELVFLIGNMFWISHLNFLLPNFTLLPCQKADPSCRINFDPLLYMIHRNAFDLGQKRWEREMPNLNDTTWIDILPKILCATVLGFKLNFKELKKKMKEKDLNKYGLDITESQNGWDWKGPLEEPLVQVPCSKAGSSRTGCSQLCPDSLKNINNMWI